MERTQDEVTGSKRFEIKPIEIHVYFHVAIMNNWVGVFHELLYDMQHSGLLDHAETVSVCTSGGELRCTEEAECKRLGITTFAGSEKLYGYEFPTLGRLQVKAKERPEAAFLYIHTKGVSQPLDAHRIAWRREMADFVINDWQTRILHLQTQVSSGPRVTPGGAGGQGEHVQAVGHYSGNFWWARGDYLATLPDPLEFFGRTNSRMAAESWIGQHGCFNGPMGKMQVPTNAN